MGRGYLNVRATGGAVASPFEGGLGGSALFGSFSLAWEKWTEIGVVGISPTMLDSWNRRENLRDQSLGSSEPQKNAVPENLKQWCWSRRYEYPSLTPPKCLQWRLCLFRAAWAPLYGPLYRGPKEEGLLRRASPRRRPSAAPAASLQAVPAA